MTAFIKLLHLAAAIVWLGGMAFMLLALRPAAAAALQPPARLPFLVNVLSRFFMVVWGTIAILLLTGFQMFASISLRPPAGWHAMAGLGILMCLIFAHIYFVPFRRLKLAVAQANWAEGGRHMGRIATLVTLNFTLGWIAIAAIFLV